MEVLAGYILGVLSAIILSKKGFNITIRNEYEDKTVHPTSPSEIPEDFEKDEYKDQVKPEGMDDVLNKLNLFMTGGDEDDRE